MTEQSQFVLPEFTELDADEIIDAERKFLAFLDTRVVGQFKAKKLFANLYLKLLLGKPAEKGVLGSLMLIGPSTVGKDLLIKALAEYWLGDEDAYHRIDLSTYLESSDGRRLNGAPPSYVDGDVTPEFSRRAIIKAKKGSTKFGAIVALSEADKAHPVVFNNLLQLLREGNQKDSHNRSHEYGDVLFIMTSNLGMHDVAKDSVGMGFLAGREPISNQEIEAAVTRALTKRYTPEMLNRIDDVVILDQLTDVEVAEAAAMLFERFETRGVERITGKGEAFSLDLNSSVRDHLLLRAKVAAKAVTAAKGMGSALTELVRLFKKEVEAKVVRLYLSDRVKKGDCLMVLHVPGSHKITFKVSRGLFNVATSKATTASEVAPDASASVVDLSDPLPQLVDDEAVDSQADGAEASTDGKAGAGEAETEEVSEQVSVANSDRTLYLQQFKIVLTPPGQKEITVSDQVTVLLEMRGALIATLQANPVMFRIVSEKYSHEEPVQGVIHVNSAIEIMAALRKSLEFLHIETVPTVVPVAE